MSGAMCQNFPICMEATNDATIPKCDKPLCPGKRTWSEVFHTTPKPDACEHDFQGWRDHKDEQGRVMGGEQVCTKCGMGAMTHSLRTGF